MNIYIKPDLEEHLRKEKSMSGLVNSLLFDYYDKQGKNIQRPVVKNSLGQTVEATAENPSSKRTTAEVLADIRETERARDEQLEWCQDADEANRISSDAKEVIDALWQEYHALKPKA